MKNSKSNKVVATRIQNYPEEKEFTSFLIDDQWLVVDPTNPDNSTTFSLKKLFEGMSIEYEITMKLIILAQLKTNENKIYSKVGSLKTLATQISICTRILKAMGFDSLKDINAKNVNDFFNQLIKKIDGDLYAMCTIRVAVMKFLTESSRANNNYPDGPTVQITWDGFLDSVKPMVTKVMTWAEWQAGGTFGGFPIEYALVILDESLKIINDKESTKIAKAHLYGMKNAQVQDSSIKMKDFFQIFNGLYLRKCGYDKTGFFIENNRKNASNLKIYQSDSLAKKQWKTFTIAKCIYDKYLELGGRSEVFKNFLTIVKLNKLIQNILHACTANIQILSGIRKSELDSLKRSSFKKVLNGDLFFTSSIKKTNHSIDTVRMISNVAWDAVELAKSLHVSGNYPNNNSSLDRLLKINVPYRKTLISGNTWGGDNKKNETGLTNWMNAILVKRVAGIDLNSFSNATSHRFRHTWVEIALRRFDGNVPEAIRQYFRHSHGSKNTMAYVNGKVKQELPQLERDYIREIIGRAASGKEEFYGPIGTYLLQRVKELDVLTDENIEELANEFDVLEPHEYGYCMIRKEQKTQAKCYDKKTNSPNYNAARFKHCGACVGNLRMASHKDSILRIGMREQEVIESRKSKGLMFLADQSQKILKLCESAINQMDKKIPVSIIDEELNNEHV